MATKTKKKSLFIRFNEIPENGQSFIYDENNIICGHREGVSVYDAVKVDGKYTPVLPPQASRETREEFYKYTIYNTSKNYKKMYLVSGDLVARDERHCPIITNIEILDEMDFDTEFPDRRPPVEATEVKSDTGKVDDFVTPNVETTKNTINEINNSKIVEVGKEKLEKVKKQFETTGEKVSKFAKAFSVASKAFIDTMKNND